MPSEGEEVGDFVFQAMTETGLVNDRQKQMLIVVLEGIAHKMPEIWAIMENASARDVEAQFRAVCKAVKMIDDCFQLSAQATP